MWKGRASDRPQARLAAAIAAYDPPGSQENLAMRVVESALALHRAMCECGNTKNHPDDPTCAACVVFEGTLG